MVLEVTIHNKELLEKYAKERYEECWSDQNWKPGNLADAVYEVLVASNENPSPDEYGISIRRVE